MTYSPWRHVRQMPGVVVAMDDLEHAQAYWEPDHQVILLDRRLNQAERRSCLAHELQHIEAGDTCCDVGPDGARQSRRQETRADGGAARQLITLDALADALLWCLGPDEVAEHLHVDERTVRARIRGLTDDEKTYIESRIAARDGAA